MSAITPVSKERAAPGIRLILHGPLALRLRWRLRALQGLLDSHSFWACGRNRRDLAQMIKGSQAVVSAWRGVELLGFGRATSDGAYRAVLWDVVVAEGQQGQGLGRRIVETLLACPPVARAERVYVMTTNSAGFYRQLGFTDNHPQQLLVLTKSVNL